jgi:hypothetical protein
VHASRAAVARCVRRGQPVVLGGLATACVVIASMQAALLANAKPAWRPGGGEARLETEGVVSRLIGSGWVRTSRAYLDATVELEFRAVGPQSDGAVLLRAVLPRPRRETRVGLPGLHRRR